MKIHLPNNIQNINILMSGGADSTLLTYLISKQTTNNIICHTLPILDETYENVVLPIIDFLTNVFGNRYSYYRIKQRNFFIRDAVDYILSVYPGVVLTGCNKVVTHFTPTVYIPGDTPPVRGPVSSNMHLRPFIDLDKVKLFKIYQDENILPLLSLTRSCGMPGLHRCGGCYFCMEREWAAKTIGINDINNIQNF